MGLLRGIKNGVKSAFNVKKWVGTEHLKANAGLIKNVYQKVSNNREKDTAVTDETFDAFIERQGLTEQTLQERIRYYRNVVWMFWGGTVLLLGYDIHLLLHGSLIAVFECSMLALLLSALGLKSYISLHLLRTRKLRTTMRDVVSSLKFWR